MQRCEIPPQPLCKRLSDTPRVLHADAGIWGAETLHKVSKAEGNGDLNVRTWSCTFALMDQDMSKHPVDSSSDQSEID